MPMPIDLMDHVVDQFEGLEDWTLLDGVCDRCGALVVTPIRGDELVEFMKPFGCPEKGCRGTVHNTVRGRKQ